MITNSSLTVYHRDGLDVATHLEKWTRHNYENVWFFGGKGAGINKGYDDANDVEVRIPYNKNNGLNVNDFAIGDILVQGTLKTEIDTQQDLEEYLTYNIKSINNKKKIIKFDLAK